MINCIIIDDEPLAQDILESHISQYGQLKLIKRCDNALDAFNVLHNQKIDLMFLDIKMPSINGIDFIRSIKNPPNVIFTTAYTEHAITGFELEAIDYLLKPITYDRFKKSINKLLKINKEDVPEQKNFTYFKVSGSLVKIFHEEILYAQSVKDYILLITGNGKVITHMTMKYLNDLLPAQQFIRVHRSFTVNKSCVNIIGKSTLNISDKIIPIGENYRPNIKLINSLRL